MQLNISTIAARVALSLAGDMSAFQLTLITIHALCYAQHLMRRLAQEGFVSREKAGKKGALNCSGRDELRAEWPHLHLHAHAGRKVTRRHEEQAVNDGPVKPTNVAAAAAVGKRKACEPARARKQFKDLEVAPSQETEAANVKCSVTSEPLAQSKRRRTTIAKEE